MWSNGFQRRIELAVPDARAAALLTLLPAVLAAAAAWLYFAHPLPRATVVLVLLLAGWHLSRRALAGGSRRFVRRAVLDGQSHWALCSGSGERSSGRLVHGWELAGPGSLGLLGLGWSTPSGYRYLLAFTHAVPAATRRRLRVHRRLAAGDSEPAATANRVTLRRGQSRRDESNGGRNPRR